MESGRETIERIARSKGKFTRSFRRRAQEEAEGGRTDMLEIMEGAEELRADLSRALEMYGSSRF